MNKKPKLPVGIILSTHSRTGDALAHLDVISCYRFEVEVIPVYMRKDSPEKFLRVMEERNAIYLECSRFTLGPLLSLCRGIKRAKEMGLRYVLYRNSDDILFNDMFVAEMYAVMEKNNYLFAGYNWLTFKNYSEFSLNECWCNVDSFYPHLDAVEQYFRQESNSVVCELKLPKLVNLATKFDNSRIYKMPDREQEFGVGYEDETLQLGKGILVERGFDWDRLMREREDNTRFFNRKWQMIGSHDNEERHRYYRQIRGDIPYRDELESRENFSHWLSKPDFWNMPIVGRTVLPVVQAPVKKLMRKKLLRREPG